MTEQARKRRLQDTLIISGNGVIAYSVWGLAKTAIILSLLDEGILRRIVSIDSDIPMSAIYLVTGALLLVDLAVRWYVGASARAEGAGKSRGPAYLCVALLAALGNAWSAALVAFGASPTLSLLDLVVTLAIELSSLAALALVIYCAIGLRRLGAATG